MNQSKNSKRMMIHCYPFFYKDSNSIISNNHLENKLDEKNSLRSDIPKTIQNSKNDTKEKYQRHFESFYKTNDCNDNNNDSVNQSIIVQMDEENQCLYQMTKLQQKRIERLEEHLYYSTGGRLFF